VQRERDGLGCARADAGIGNALRGVHPIDGGRFFAGESPGAVLFAGACASAERPFVAVLEAEVLGPTGALAVRTGAARAAEVCVSRDADVGEVRTAPADRLAAPALGALLGAQLSADSVSHVLDAPPGLALLVFVARVEEAALSRLAPGKKALRAGIEEGEFPVIDRFAGGIRRGVGRSGVGDYIMCVPGIFRSPEDLSGWRGACRCQHGEQGEDGQQILHANASMEFAPPS